MGIIDGNTCLFEREKYWSSQSETSCLDSVTWSKISPKFNLSSLIFKMQATAGGLNETVQVRND